MLLASLLAQQPSWSSPEQDVIAGLPSRRATRTKTRHLAAVPHPHDTVSKDPAARPINSAGLQKAMLLSAP